MGKKLESSFKNMVLVLFLVTLVSSAAVGVVNSLTSGLIEKVKIEKQVQAIRAVVPAFNNDPMTEKQIVKVDGGELEFYPAKANGQLVGTAIKTFTNNGFGGLIELMVGFTPDGSRLRAKPQRNPGIRFQNGHMVRERCQRGYYRKNPGYARTSGFKGRRKRGCHHGRNDFITSLPRCSKPGSKGID